MAQQKIELLPSEQKILFKSYYNPSDPSKVFIFSTFKTIDNPVSMQNIIISANEIDNDGSNFFEITSEKSTELLGREVNNEAFLKARAELIPLIVPINSPLDGVYMIQIPQAFLNTLGINEKTKTNEVTESQLNAIKDHVFKKVIGLINSADTVYKSKMGLFHYPILIDALNEYQRNNVANFSSTPATTSTVSSITATVTPPQDRAESASSPASKPAFAGLAGLRGFYNKKSSSSQSTSSKTDSSSLQNAEDQKSTTSNHSPAGM